MGEWTACIWLRIGHTWRAVMSTVTNTMRGTVFFLLLAENYQLYKERVAWSPSGTRTLHESRLLVR